MPRPLQTDRWMFGSTVAMCLVGTVMVFSASAVTARDQFGNGYYFLLRQLLWLTLGLGGMMLVMNLDYRKLRRPEVIFTALFTVLAMLVGAFFLDKSHATHRWIRLGPASIQPSELAKLAVIFYLAWFLELRRRPESFGMNDWKHTIIPALRTSPCADWVNRYRAGSGNGCGDFHHRGCNALRCRARRKIYCGEPDLQHSRLFIF